MPRLGRRFGPVEVGWFIEVAHHKNRVLCFHETFHELEKAVDVFPSGFLGPGNRLLFGINLGIASVASFKGPLIGKLDWEGWEGER